MVFGASARSQAAGERVFEYCEAVLVPLGGITAAHSPSGRADPTPGREIRYTKPPSGTSPGRPSERRFGAFARSHAALAWMFGHCESALAPLGGSPVAYSSSRHAEQTPGHENRYATPPSGTV